MDEWKVRKRSEKEETNRCEEKGTWKERVENKKPQEKKILQ